MCYEKRFLKTFNYIKLRCTCMRLIIEGASGYFKFTAKLG